MCRICSCSEIGICLGNITYVIERLSSCIAATAVVICLMSTLMIMLAMGIGLGYNYCYVDSKLNETLKAANMGIVLSTLSQLMYASEKIIACFTCTMLVSCLITTFIVILTLGIGLGYNYCFVDMKTRHRYVPSGYRYPGGPRYPYNYHNRPMNWPRARQDEHFSLPTFQVTEEALLPNLTYDTITEHLEPTYGDITDSNTSITNEMSTLKTTKALLNSINSTNDTHIVNGTKSDNPGNTLNNTGIVNETNSDYHGNTMNNTVIVNGTSTENAGNTTIFTNIVNDSSIDNPGKMGGNGEVNNNNTDSESIESVITEQRPMIIPINGLDLIALLSKLRSENRNYSLQIVTT